MAVMRPYSSSLRLCSRTTSSVTGRSFPYGCAAAAASEVSGTRLVPLLPERGHDVTHDPAQNPGLVRAAGQGIELAGVEPDAPAVFAAVDGHVVVDRGEEVVPVLGAFHEMGLPFLLLARGLHLLALAPEQLGVFPGEVLVLVLAWLLGHGVVSAVEVAAVAWRVQAAIEVKKPAPSSLPSSASAARSGWGMMATTLPAGSVMPA